MYATLVGRPGIRAIETYINIKESCTRGFFTGAGRIGYLLFISN